MRIISIVGARPQFVKAAPFSREVRAAGHEEYLLHTGQHYDNHMSSVFFEQLQIPEPDINLGIGGGSHAEQLAGMIVPLEKQLLDYRPDIVVVYGDTNSTLAAALAAAKINIPIAHIEAGLRSYNRMMPEEVNRVLTDQLSTLLFCPTRVAVDNLEIEGIKTGVHETGDIMMDAVRLFSSVAQEQSTIYANIDIDPDAIHGLVTLHRPANTDNPIHLQNIADAISQCGYPIIFPMHPRTKNAYARAGITFSGPVHIIEPIGYFDMLALLNKVNFVVTDSGGVQKEAFFVKTPCVTIRTETEWVETIAMGWNRLVDPSVEAIHAGIESALHTIPSTSNPVYGDGFAAQKIVKILKEFIG